MGDVQTLSVAIPQELAQYWGWFLALGIALLVLGVAAVARAFTATIVSMLFFGWMLVFASAIEIVQAIMVGHWAGQVAKRVDVFAAALFHGTSVEALNDLDLSYTPPFSAPWDPVQVASSSLRATSAV